MKRIARIEVSMGLNGDACVCCEENRTPFVLEANCGEGPHEEAVEAEACDRCLVRGNDELTEYHHAELVRAAEEGGPGV